MIEWLYDHTTAQDATFNMHGQLYRRYTNAMALFSSPVVSVLGLEWATRVLVEKKNASSAFRLG